tara:strand:- start:267 stop:728 length:462 start_codon:yes stop_codon:yes gene_type:complete
MLDNVDIFKIILESENPDTQVEASGQYGYKINLPSKKVNYKKIMLYVDNFQICLKGLTTESVEVKASLPQYNSYNSRTKANNTTIACVYNPNTASGRTADLSIQYQNSTAPFEINNLPNDLRIDLVDQDNAGINMSNANNFFQLDLRIEAFYD